MVNKKCNLKCHFSSASVPMSVRLPNTLEYNYSSYKTGINIEKGRSIANNIRIPLMKNNKENGSYLISPCNHNPGFESKLYLLMS